eukprot:5179742-Pleurochrysis_carterae.AAC.1
MDELLNARSRASSWCWATDMFKLRSCLSRSTNSGARVAALTAASLMRGKSPPCEPSVRVG